MHYIYECANNKTSAFAIKCDLFGHEGGTRMQIQQSEIHNVA